MTPTKTCLPMLAALALLLGLFSQRPGIAHAASAWRSQGFITDCRDDTQLQEEVSTATSGETIVFRCSGEIDLTRTLIIKTNLTLSGDRQHVTLDGHNMVQVFVVNPGITFTLKTLTITGGFSSTSGGGLLNNGGTVTICHSTFSHNTAFGNGGGINNDGGMMIITESRIAHNTAGFNGFGNGGGIDNNGGIVTITESRIAHNTAASVGVGGGINNADGTVTIDKSLITHNRAGSGGGIDNNGGWMTIIESRIAHNTAGSGGGIDNNEISGWMTIIESLITHNTAGSSGGGGIDNGGWMTIIKSRITHNTTSSNGGGINNEPTVSTVTTISNSVLRNNHPTNCAGVIVNGGGNHSSDPSCGF